MSVISVSTKSFPLASSISSPDQISALERDGVVIARGALSHDMLDLIRQGMDRHLSMRGPNFQSLGSGGARYMTDFDSWQRIPEYRAFLEKSPVAAMAAHFLDSTRIWLQEDHVFWQEPGTAYHTAWHQDVPFRGFPGRVISIWLSLEPTVEGGSLEFIRGSHLWGELAPPGMRGANSIPDIEKERARHEILSWAVEPGDCLVFFGHTVHGARPDRRNLRRRFSSRWTDVDADWDKGASVQGELHPVLWTE